MTVDLDPDGVETAAFREAAGDLTGKRVLEVGSGDGRLTWLYAGQAGSVTGIDPKEDRTSGAETAIPDGLVGRIKFLPLNLEDFAAQAIPAGERFDRAILSWSL